MPRRGVGGHSGRGSPVYGFAVQNIVNQFAARFQPGGEDCLYFHNETESGLPCSYDEARDLSFAFERTVKLAARAMLAWVLLAALVLGVVVGMSLWEPSRLEAAAIFLAPFPFAVLAVKRASDAPLEAFRMRGTAAPAREAGAARADRLAALPDGAVVLMVAVNALLAFQTLKDGVQESDYLYLSIMGASALLIAAIIGAKARRR